MYVRLLQYVKPARCNLADRLIDYLLSAKSVNHSLLCMPVNKRTLGNSSDNMMAPRVSTCMTFADGKDGEGMTNGLDNSVGIHSCSTEGIVSTSNHPA